MSVAAGLAVMQSMFEVEITAVTGVKGRHDLERGAVRPGTGEGSVTVGGRWVAVTGPRASILAGHEVGMERPAPGRDLRLVVAHPP